MIDLRSDTLTLPTERMREAAANAEVGDDKRDGDPTVGALERRVADMLGMEAAMFVPSGTMANQIAARTHTEPGEEIVVDRLAHIFTSESGGVAQLSHLQVRTIDADPRGVPTPEQVEAALAENRGRWPATGLLSLEDTHNKRGGLAISPGELSAAAEVAHDEGVPVHLDGARLANAAVALDRPLPEFTAEIDSVMFDLSKGLGAPVGAVLCGSEAFIEGADRYRALFGGGMRQAGMIAAPALESLDNVERLAEDHENARLLAEGLEETGLRVQEPETNLVFADTSETGLSAAEFVEACAAEGVGCGTVTDTRVRLCTSLNVDRDDIEEAVARVRAALGAAQPQGRR